MSTLILVRHGSTDWTSSGRLQGGVDIDLSRQGVDEVERLRPTIESMSPQLVVSSPLTRTRSTARLLGFPRAAVDPRWAEAGLGEWEGLLSSQLGDDYGRWRRGQLAPPGGESPAAVRDRITDSLAGLTGQSPVLVITHGGVIRQALDHYVGLGARSLVPVAPASITVLELEAGGDARLALFNWCPEPVLDSSVAAAGGPAAGRRVPTVPHSGTSATGVAAMTSPVNSLHSGHTTS